MVSKADSLNAVDNTFLLIPGGNAPSARVPFAAIRDHQQFRSWQAMGTAPRAWRFSLIDDAVHAELVNKREFFIPRTAITHEGFRQWARSTQCPEKSVVTYLEGQVRVDMSPENLETHNLLKGEVSSVVKSVVRQRKLGTLYFDGCLLSFESPEFTTVPDAIFVSRESFQTKRIERVASGSNPATHAELRGVPDWVLEVVSVSSEMKDKVALRDVYFKAGVKEYWIVDALEDSLQFDMLVAGQEGYERVEAVDGWYASPTFDCKFRLLLEIDDDGFWDWQLEVK